MLNEEYLRPTVLEVNTEYFKENVKKIKEYLKGNKKLIPVIKADGYGTEINTRLELIEEFDIVAVALTGEGIYLRELGFKNDILILNQPSINDISDIIKHNLTVGVASIEFLRALNEQNENNYLNVKVHIEVETGMNRTGFNINDLSEDIKFIKECENVVVEGVYSHLSSADNDDEYTKKQIKTFEKAKEIIDENINTVKYYHLEASTGILNYNIDMTNAARPGLILYGYNVIENQNDKIDLKPIAKLKSKVTFIKKVFKGERIGYAGSFVVNEDMIIATIPVGYADGIPRALSNVGEIVINNQKARVVGKICMDSFMVDVTNIKDVHVGTDVYIWDNEIITLKEMADRIDTINYEILSRISKRVRREFI